MRNMPTNQHVESTREGVETAAEYHGIKGVEGFFDTNVFKDPFSSAGADVQCSDVRFRPFVQPAPESRPLASLSAHEDPLKAAARAELRAGGLHLRLVTGRQPVPDAQPLAKLSPHEVAVLFTVIGSRKTPAFFSLGPAHPELPASSQQAAVFSPKYLAGTITGEIMFQSDLLMESIMGGFEIPPIPGWQCLKDLGMATRGTYRVWIQPSGSAVPAADVFLSSGVLMGVEVHGCPIEVKVEGQEKAPGRPAGLTGGVPLPPTDCFARMAEQCSRRMPELISCYPALQMLQQTYRALVACKAMRALGAAPGKRWCRHHAKPALAPPATVDMRRGLHNPGERGTWCDITGTCFLDMGTL